MLEMTKPLSPPTHSFQTQDFTNFRSFCCICPQFAPKRARGTSAQGWRGWSVNQAPIWEKSGPGAFSEPGNNGGPRSASFPKARIPKLHLSESPVLHTGCEVGSIGTHCAPFLDPKSTFCYYKQQFRDLSWARK